MAEAKDQQAHVVLGLPSYDGTFMLEMQQAMENLIQFSTEQGIKIGYLRCRGSMIWKMRDSVVHYALENKATHVLFIDSDMWFPEYGLMQLLSHKADIVSGMYFSKQKPYNPIAATAIEGKAAYKPIKVWKVGLQEVDAVGGGFLLIRTKVFKRFKAPWFAAPPALWREIWPFVEKFWDTKEDPKAIAEQIVNHYRTLQDVNHANGEDYFFSWQAQRHGFKVLLDTTLQLSHMGPYPFNLNNHFAYKKMKKREQEALDERQKSTKPVEMVS